MYVSFAVLWRRTGVLLKVLIVFTFFLMLLGLTFGPAKWDIFGLWTGLDLSITTMVVRDFAF